MLTSTHARSHWDTHVGHLLPPQKHQQDWSGLRNPYIYSQGDFASCFSLVRSCTILTQSQFCLLLAPLSFLKNISVWGINHNDILFVFCFRWNLSSLFSPVRLKWTCPRLPPQTDSQTEITNQTLKLYLPSHSLYYEDNWSFLSPISLVYWNVIYPYLRIPNVHKLPFLTKILLGLYSFCQCSKV